MKLVLLVTIVALGVFTVTNAAPIAMHQLVVIEENGDGVIRLQGHDTATPSSKMTFTTKSAPSSAGLHQLSQVYSSYGYEPKAGTQITSSADTVVTGSNNRLYYRRPSPDAATINKWDTITFTASDGSTDSSTGTVTIVPPSGALVGSDFLLDSDSWTITGNKAASSAATYEAYSRGALLNHYVYGTDDKVNVNSAGSTDSSLWYFESPTSFHGNQGIAYGGSISFTLGAFSGDFTKQNGESAHMVQLECAECPGPVSKGVTLAFPVSAYTALSGGSTFTGDTMAFSIPLLEGKGWLKDSQNTLTPWTAASKCDVIQVLSRLSGFRILGDWTTWYESVALDNVQLANTKGQLPLCAMSMNDASICTC